jgi:hypothetical protein
VKPSAAEIVLVDVKMYTGLSASLFPGTGELVHDSRVVFSIGLYTYSGWSKR